MKFNWLKREGDAIKFTGHLMEVYIPKYYFDKKLANFKGDQIETLGIFMFRVTSENGTESIHTMKLPMRCSFEFESFYNQNAKLKESTGAEDYTVFVIKNGMTFLDSVRKEKSAANSKDFVFSLHGGKMPSTIPYPELIQLYIDNLNLNGTKIANPSCILEITIAELSRDMNDISTPFRKTAGSGKETNMNNYKMINIKDLPPLNSTFTALSFEDMDASIITSIKKRRNNEKEQESPVEKVIKY